MAMINKESWYMEAFDPQWSEFETAFERGALEESRYGEWLNLALRTNRLQEIPQEIIGAMTRLRFDMSTEEIEGAWRLALTFDRLPDGLTLEMVKKSEKAGVSVIAVCWIYSSASVPGYDGDLSLQYDGPVAPDLKTYSHGANQYNDLKYQLRQSPGTLLKRLHRLGWVYSEDEGVHYSREFEPRRFPGRRQLSEWARDLPVTEELKLHLNELLIHFSGKAYKLLLGKAHPPWSSWVREVFERGSSK